MSIHLHVSAVNKFCYNLIITLNFSPSPKPKSVSTLHVATGCTCTCTCKCLMWVSLLFFSVHKKCDDLGIGSYYPNISQCQYRPETTFICLI